MFVHADVDGSRRRGCRQRCLRDRCVSIPPYLRPIEEESDGEDQLESSRSTDHCRNSSTTTTSAAGTRDVTAPGPASERLENRDVIFDKDGANRDDDVTESSLRDCRQPISERLASDVTTTDHQCTCEDASRCEKYLSDNVNLPGKSASHRPINECDENDVRAGESPQTSKQHWRLFYVIVASLTAFVACLSSMSPSGFIFIVTVMSLIAHHVTQS